jgi:hypothetical protein
MRFSAVSYGILSEMKHRFLFHSLNHTVLVVDITEIGIPRTVIEPEGQAQHVPSIRFRNWVHATEYLTNLGASSDSLAKVSGDLRKTNAAVLTIT